MIFRITGSHGDETQDVFSTSEYLNTIGGYKINEKHNFSTNF
jgi:hypothetical protein